MVHEIIFDSAAHPQGQLVGLACGYISENAITFVQEQTLVLLDACTGEVRFRDLEGGKEAAAKVKLPSAGDEKFSELKCCVEGALIRLGFPRYTYKDHYPNCDGEHDRWEKCLAGFDFLDYDLRGKTIL